MNVPCKAGSSNRTRWLAGTILAPLSLAVGCTHSTKNTRPAERVLVPVSDALISGDQLANDTTNISDEGLAEPVLDAETQVLARPPVGWTRHLISEDRGHEHYNWISPTGRTSYGVIFFRMPFPVGHELAFTHGFLRAMRNAEGEATVLEKHWDPAIDAMRFVVEGGKYIVRSQFIVRGVTGWAVYAGTRRDQPIEPGELELAERARECTVIERK